MSDLNPARILSVLSKLTFPFDYFKDNLGGLYDDLQL